MHSYLVLDIETCTISKERLDSFIAKFEPASEEPEEIDESDIKPKKGAKKSKAGKSTKAKTKPKSERGGLHYLTGQICVAGVKPFGEEPVMFGDKDESVVLVGLYEYLKSVAPYTVVTYNGSEFDIPFIRMRGLLYGLDFSSLLPIDKYSKTHIDLYSQLGGKWVLPSKLSELCWYFDIPDIEDSGANVQKLYEEGNIAQIVAHCRGDVIATEKLYKRIFPGGKRTTRYINKE